MKVGKIGDKRKRKNMGDRDGGENAVRTYTYVQNIRYVGIEVRVPMYICMLRITCEYV